MKGFKAFNANMTCRDYQFEIGKKYVHEGPVVLCSSGFHFCTNAQDVLNYYIDKSMRICEIEASGEITHPKEDCSKRSCSEITILREISFDEFYPLITESQWAYYWAKDIGNHDNMMPLITESGWAYYWARNIGNHAEMMPRITESQWAFYWAKDIGNHAEMMPRITESQWAYRWVQYIGNHAEMIPLITDSQYAYLWAKDIGNHDNMIPLITDQYWLNLFNELETK